MGRIFTPKDSDFGQADAVVIGGGIVGTATAFWLARAQLNVVLEPAHTFLLTSTSPVVFGSWNPGQ